MPERPELPKKVTDAKQENPDFYSRRWPRTLLRSCAPSGQRGLEANAPHSVPVQNCPFRCY
eukprot:3934252-Pleurochrysis_carterae.AAC.1